MQTQCHWCRAHTAIPPKQHQIQIPGSRLGLCQNNCFTLLHLSYIATIKELISSVDGGLPRHQLQHNTDNHRPQFPPGAFHEECGNPNRAPTIPKSMLACVVSPFPARNSWLWLAYRGIIHQDTLTWYEQSAKATTGKQSEIIPQTQHLSRKQPTASSHLRCHALDDI